MKQIIFIFLAFLFSGALFSQEVVLEKNVDEQYQKEKGPNTTSFGQFYVGLGGMADYDEKGGAAINAWKSDNSVVGYRYKLKLLSFYALGFDVSFKTDKFFMAEDDLNPYDSMNPLTFTIGEKRQTFTNSGLGLEIYQRINIGRRGNTLGKFLDTGIRGQWNIMNVEELIINNKDATYIGRQRVINRRLQYVENFTYGLTARLGYNHLTTFGFYRLSDLFKDSYGIPELPRLSFGLQYSFY